MSLSVRIAQAPRGTRGVVNRLGFSGGLASPASLLPRIRPGALFAALLAASPLFSPDDARAQAMVCTPTQTVSAEAAANSLYTTTLTCADTSAAAGAADYRHLHYNHRAGPGLDPADRDTTLTNNNMGNNLALTISRGVIFTADGYADLRVVPTDAAILLYHAGAKSVTVEDGAVINLERTPRGYSATDPNRPASATTEYNPAWYHNFQSVVDELAAIAVRSRTTDGDADIAIRHDGVIEIDIEMIGTYAEAPWSYGTNAGAAIEALVTEERRFGPFTRTDIDIDIDVGATGVIRHAEGTDGLNAIRAENASEDGDITIDLAEGSLIDVSEGGGYGVFAKLQLGGPVGQQRGDIIVNAAGTIKTAVKSRVWTRGRGMGIYAESEAHSGRVRIASSGTIETVQAAAIDARATRATNVQRDDPDTEEIEGHVVDVTGGTIETRGATAIYASISNYDSIANANSATTVSHMTVRVAEGATVRAQALTTEDYANGAIPQETLEASGRAYIDRGSSRWHGWRLVDVERTTDSGETETVKRLEPIITGIAVRDLSEVAAAAAPRDQVLVDGTVETVGGKANVDPAIWLEGGGLVVVGANGRVGADSGLAISGGCSSDYRNLDYVPVDGVYATVDCDEVEARALEVRVAGTVDGDIRVLDEGVLSLASMEDSTVTGTVHDPAGPLTVAGSIGRLLYTSGGTVTVARTGALTGVEVEGRTEALGSEAGDLSLSVDDMGMVSGDVQARGDGRLTLDLKAGGAVTGTVHDPAGPLTVAGRIGRLLYTNGGTVTVARTGALTGVEVEGGTEAISSKAGTLDLTVSGQVAGDHLRAPSGGTLKLAVREGGKVPGTVHDPAGPLTVAGSIGRLLYTNGGTVTVSGGGKLTGVEGTAVESTAGPLSVTVNDEGRVEGDLESGGTLTANVMSGGVVTGTIHDPVGPLTVAGSIGRLLYTNGGTVTVAATGRLTGVEVEGKTQALHSAAGALDLTVSGQVAGDLRAPSGGTLKLAVREGGKVPGTVHDPVGPLTVAGEIGRLLYTSGGTVTVARTGALTGVEGETEALRSEAGDLALSVAGMGRVTGDVRALGDGDLRATVAGTLTGDLIEEGDGDLDATISGTLTGDVSGLGAGEHVVTVSKGGTVTGTIHLAASTVGVDGRAGRVHFDQGGTVTVGGTGWITGIEGVAIRNAAGELVVSVADGGRITGDIIGRGTRPARVTTGSGSRVEGSIDVAAAGSELRVGGTVTGSIDMAGSELRVDGTVEGRVRYRRGGMVTVGPDGRIEGKVSRGDRGEEIMAVVERKPEETTRAAVVKRAFPGGIDIDLQTIEVKPGFELAREHEPRMRVYEALPSVVLGLNGLRGYGERMAVPRSAKGGWARVERFQGKWKADASASGKESGVGLRYRHQRHGVEVGLGGALGEEGHFGASLHHRRGTAKVTEGGDVELYGTGAGVSGTWMRAGDYVDVQAAMTWYEADLTSSRRGVLRKDVSGLGHALGVEAGRRMELEGLPAGMVLIPRVGLVHSQVSMDAFSDVTGARVTVDDARSLKGRAGVDVEAKPGGAAGSRVFGSVEVEHELSTERKVRVSGTGAARELESEAEATWLRLGLNGVHTWEEGRYTVQGGVGYATSGDSHELGGGVSLNLRF